MKPARRPNALILFVFAAVTLSSEPALALGWSYGVTGGFGGVGISSTKKVDDGSGTLVATQYQKAQGPGTIGLSADYLFQKNMMLSVMHLRGFTFGPVASSVSLTGLSGRYYLNSAIMSSEPTGNPDAVLHLRKIAYFGSVIAGLAKGSIETPDETFSEISASGLYFGFGFGADFLVGQNWGFRPEIDVASTLFNGGAESASIKAFSAQCGIFFFL